MFVSEYFGLDDELDRIGVFDCVLDKEYVKEKYGLNVHTKYIAE